MYFIRINPILLKTCIDVYSSTIEIASIIRLNLLLLGYSRRPPAPVNSTKIIRLVFSSLKCSAHHVFRRWL